VAQEASPAPDIATPPPPAVAPVGNANRGAIVFRSSCGLCHRDPKKFAKRFQGKDPRVRGIPLEDYVNGHHAPQIGPKRDLMVYLKTL